jgi:hypothetical protein
MAFHCAAEVIKDVVAVCVDCLGVSGDEAGKETGGCHGGRSLEAVEKWCGQFSRIEAERSLLLLLLCAFATPFLERGSRMV